MELKNLKKYDKETILRKVRGLVASNGRIRKLNLQKNAELRLLRKKVKLLEKKIEFLQNGNDLRNFSSLSKQLHTKRKNNEGL